MTMQLDAARRIVAAAMGRVRSPAKTAANRKKIAEYWVAVRAGILPPPNHRKK